MSSSNNTEGTVAWGVPHAGKDCWTWYRIVGDIKGGVTPLITAHGGPGEGHEYLLPLADLHEKYSIPVIFYDQIGCGKSTRLREKDGDTAFWTVELFLHELDNLINHLGFRESGFDFLGQSWGGMLGGVWAAGHPKGLRKLILADAPSSIPLLLEGENKLVEQLPEDVRKTLDECDKKGDYESDAYKNACLVFYKRHLCRLDPMPEGVLTALNHLESDPTVYKTMYGPSELKATGPLKDWVGWTEAHKINVPTLLINGRYDEVQDVALEPWFEHIPKVKWVQLEKSSHMGHYEERDRYMQFCGSFLRGPKAI